MCCCCTTVNGSPCASCCRLCAGCASGCQIDQLLNCCGVPCVGPSGSCLGAQSGPNGSPSLGLGQAGQSGRTSSCFLGSISNLGYGVASSITGRAVLCKGGVKSLSPNQVGTLPNSTLLVAAGLVAVVLIFGLGRK